ncbi:MAG: hypothetical protein P1U85_10975 [Verrucomicrobiales bacterium]|nr:hypothetical protein [Verrucomicrobiales bacterium]
MKKPDPIFTRGSFLLGIGLMIFLSLAPVITEEPWEDFAKAALSRVEEKPHVRGQDSDWFFPVRELKHLGTGKYWEQEWAEVASNQADPVPSLLEFRDLLKEKGIALILVPVPPKASLYPEKLDEEFAPGDPVSTTPFWRGLQEKGLDVLDLFSSFSELRKEGDAPLLYCRQDSHYSPFAIQKVAALIVGKAPDLVGKGDGSLRLGAEEELSIVGDQVVGSEWEGKVAGETLRLQAVLEDGERGVEPNPESPFLLLGDSHTLVFQQGKEGGMHTKGAGLLDHLSLGFGEPFDLVGVRGSGMVQARKQLFYRAAQNPGYWDSKKLVVWVFSERELTQSIDRLISIPLER